MNTSFSFHPISLPTGARRRILVPALLAILLGLGAFSFAPSVYAASLTHTSAANGSAGSLAANGTVEGCPLGYACIYPVNAGWNNGHPEARGFFYTYGTHVLSNEFNTHRVFNNQTGSALVYLCYHADGTDCDGPLCTYGDDGGLLYGYNYVDTNMTPYNSIKLTPPKSGYC
jgi:hypothetical protein